MRPPDLPPAASYQHGTRARYVTGCRCAPCRAANTRAYHERQARALAELKPGATSGPCPGVNGKPCPRGSQLRKDSKGGICGRCRELLLWNGLVDAARARQHLVELAAAGVGRRSVEAASDVADTVLSEIKSGRKQRIRAETERRILAVDAKAIADHAVVDGREAFKLIRAMLRAGLTKGEIAQRLGAKTPALQIRRRAMLASTVLRVERLHREVMAELELGEQLGDVCPDCGYSHAKDERQRLIARAVLDGVDAVDIRDEWSCFYAGEKGAAMFSRDRRDILERGRTAA